MVLHDLTWDPIGRPSMGSLLLGDLNDYIQPSVACIKPSTTEQTTQNNVSVSINLNDCLACSGCITSSETVLITQQTSSLLLETLQTHTVVISVCSSTRIALAHRYNLSPYQVHQKLCYFFKKLLGCEMVLDVGFAGRLALREVAEEFIARMRMENSKKVLPMLTSECPGWICYAEKKQPSMLPLLSTIRSPQQITGILVKRYLLPNLPRDKVFHCSVMSCYDKKLEASRDEFSEMNIRDVDCVITTEEVLALVEDKTGKSFVELPLLEEPKEKGLLETISYDQKFIGFEGSSAGGYLFHVLRKAANKLFNIKLDEDLISDPRIRIVHHRNADYTEYTLSDDGGKALLSFASVYGFKNIQTFVQKNKTNRVSYDFVEVMACPGACLFGGGQPKPDHSNNKPTLQEYRKSLEEMYHNETQLWKESDDDDQVERIYDWVRCDPDIRHKFLKATFKQLDENKNPLIKVQW